jgi:HicB family
MSRLTLRLPESLHQQLVSLADIEGVSLNHYIVYALTIQSSSTNNFRQSSQLEIERQKASFEKLKNGLKPASLEEIETFLAEREPVAPEPELTPEIIAAFREKIRLNKE